MRHGRDPGRVRAQGFADLDKVKGTADRVNAANELARATRHHPRLPQPLLGAVPLLDGRPALLHLFEHLAPDVVRRGRHLLGAGRRRRPGRVRRRARRARRLAAREGRARRRSGRARWSPVGDGAIDIPGVLAASPRGDVAHRRARPVRHRHVRRGRAQLRLPGGQRPLAGPVVSDRAGRDRRVRRHQPHLRATRSASSTSSISSRAPTSIPERAEELAAEQRQSACDCSLRRGARRSRHRRDRQPHPTADARRRSTAPRSTPGKAAFSEKPLGVDFDEGRRARGPRDRARICASAARPTPSSASGSRPVATVIDRGDIGEPLAANAFMLGSGPGALAPEPRRSSTSAAPARCSTWARTTSPRSCSCSGPARRIGAIGAASRTRSATITSEPLARRADRRRGADPREQRSSSSRRAPIATLVTSFDVQARRYRNIEMYGTEATLSVPEPEHVRRTGDDPAPSATTSWTEIELLDRAHPAAPRHRPRRHDLGAAHAAAPTARPSDARAARARADDRPRSRRRSRAGTSSSQTTCERAEPLPVGLPAEHVRRLKLSDDMEPLRYGIVGAGFVSQFHLRALESVRGVEVAGLTSRTAPHALAESVACARARRGAGVRDRARDGATRRRRRDLQRPTSCRVDVMEEIAAAVRRRRAAQGTHLREAARPQPRRSAPRRRARDARSAHRPRTSRTRST